MGKKERIDRIYKLVEADWELGGFPYEDCRKIFKQLSEHEWDMIPDLNTFFYSLWSLSAIEKLLKMPTEQLIFYKQWLEKSFFERFPKYLPAKDLITPEFTPILYKQITINEELREILLSLVAEEIAFRKVKSS